jgi:predicted nuclease of restriction endonuclease-like RecB superfamily
LDLPGIGLCVPDLTFTHAATDRRVYLEVMGYWSRDAVWRRVEMVEAGLPHTVIFAVSSRLRVSEEALGDDLPGQLYVYKGVMSARAIAERLDAAVASGRTGGTP